MVTTTVERISKAAGGIMLVTLPTPMVCTKVEETPKDSRGRHSEAKNTH